MGERIFLVDVFSLVDFLGVEDKNFKYLKGFFPKLKLVSRGNEIICIGNDQDSNDFEQKLQKMVSFFQRTGHLSKVEIKNIIESAENDFVVDNDKDALLIGCEGKRIKARTKNQQIIVESIDSNDLIFAVGPAGTGKTYTAVALAVRALKNKEIKRIILTRPAVEAGENLGYLPGDLRDKLDPYLQPLYDALRDMFPQQKLSYLMEEKIIEIAPLAFMRGRTLDNAFVILDEAQNATNQQMKMFLTRMGRSAKFFVTGDLTQVDLPRSQKSGLSNAIHMLNGIKGVEIVTLDNSDIIRHHLVSQIITAYTKEEEKEKNKYEINKK